MKKFFSAIIAVSMIASTLITSAFASTTLNATLSNNKSTKTLVAGDTVNVTVTLADAQFANFEFTLTYDSTAFEYVKGGKASSSNLDGAVVFGNPSAGTVLATYANAVDETLIVEVEDEETGEVSEVAAKNTFYWQFKVTDAAVTGSYSFTLSQDELQQRATSSIDYGALTTVIGAPTSVSVEGVAAEKEAEMATIISADNKADVATGADYTQGFSASITPNDDTVNGITYTLTTDEAGKTPYNGTWTFDAPLTGNSAVTFGINVLNVPNAQTVTISNVAMVKAQ